jgi:hypothetical protein
MYDEILLDVPQISVFPLREVSRLTFEEIKRSGRWPQLRKYVRRQLNQEILSLGRRYGLRNKRRGDYKELSAKVSRILDEVESLDKISSINGRATVLKAS